jgi:Zn-finger nucleic acid-binding protein
LGCVGVAGGQIAFAWVWDGGLEDLMQKTHPNPKPNRTKPNQPSNKTKQNKTKQNKTKS